MGVFHYLRSVMCLLCECVFSVRERVYYLSMTVQNLFAKCQDQFYDGVEIYNTSQWNFHQYDEYATFYIFSVCLKIVALSNGSFMGPLTASEIWCQPKWHSHIRWPIVWTFNLKVNVAFLSQSLSFARAHALKNVFICLNNGRR